MQTPIATFTPTGEPKVTLVKNGVSKQVDPGAVDYFIQKGGYAKPSDVATVAPPVLPGAKEQFVGGSDTIREGQQVVKSDAQDVLSKLDSVSKLRQTTIDTGLKSISNAIANTERLLSGDFNANEQSRIDSAGQYAGSLYDPAIARAKESARQGTAKAVVGAGERGGFMNTQFAGQAALTPTEGDSFIGKGGEISKIKGQLEQNIATLETEQARAIQAAQMAARDAMITGSRQSLADAQTYAEMADKAAQIREEAITKRIEIISQINEQERTSVNFANMQEDRQFDQLKDIISSGVDTIPPELLQSIDARYGEGFAQEYLDAVKASSQAGSELEAMDKITSILARVPEGQSITVGDSIYTGYKSVDPNTKTFSEEDRAGNVTYVTLDAQGKIISQASGGRIGKGSAPAGGGGGSGSDAEDEIKSFREDAADLIEKIDTGKVPWSAAFDQLKVKYPQAEDSLINSTLGGGIPYDPNTNTFDTEAAYGRAVAKPEEE